MTQETLDFIHRSYQLALETSKNIMQILENLYNILKDAEVSDEDSKAYDAFIDGLRNCIRIRKMTSDMTDVVTYITITLMHIVRWLNTSQQIDIDIDLHGRRKSLESDLTKLLRKSTQTRSAKIRDRMGLRAILLNKPEQQAISYIYLIYDAITGILAAKDRKMRKQFFDWIEKNEAVNPINRIVIKEVLNIPFDIDEEKNYIQTPKPNGYRSFHFTLNIQQYSQVNPGSQVEIQLRTENMDNAANSGSASHEEYKKYHDDDVDLDTSDDNPLLRVFVVDDFSKLHIPGFTSYETKDADKDGIHHPKEFTNRRINPILVPTDSSL